MFVSAALWYTMAGEDRLVAVLVAGAGVSDDSGRHDADHPRPPHAAHRWPIPYPCIARARPEQPPDL